MRFQCPECQEIVVVDNSAAGKMVQCGRCQKNVQVPASRTAPGIRRAPSSSAIQTTLAA